jgi:hypothetical protein
MERYIGLDAHGASCTFGVIGPSGRKLRQDVVETHGAALVQYLRNIPGRKHLCLEEGTHSAWLYEILSPHVEEIVVAGIGKSRGQKNDTLDAFQRAEDLRTGAITTRVFKAPRRFGRLRELSRVHSMFVGDLVRVQNRLKVMYRARGVPTPGLGPIRVAQLLPIVITPHRFRSRSQFWAYCGFGVVMRSSSDWVRAPTGQWARANVQQTRGLNRNHNSRLKYIFKGAATTIITQLRSDPLFKHYLQLTSAGTKPNLAKLTIARQVAAIVLRMWKDEKEYDPGKLKQEIIASAVD